jgi:hypothetical protein
MITHLFVAAAILGTFMGLALAGAMYVAALALEQQDRLRP